VLCCGCFLGSVFAVVLAAGDLNLNVFKCEFSLSSLRLRPGVYPQSVLWCDDKR